MRKRMLGALSAVMVVTALTAGCGSTGGYDNASRPPAPVIVSVSLSNSRIQLSPEHVGAGPVVLLISNQSDKSRSITLARAQGASNSCVAADASSGPISPRGVARMAVELVEGICAVGVEDGGLPAARLSVGHKRPTAQADLLQP